MIWPEFIVQSDRPQGVFQSIHYPVAALNLAEIAGDSKASSLNGQGRYPIQSCFKQATTPENRNKVFARLVQPSASQHPERAVGMHWPLPVGTRVITAHAYNRTDNVFVLGVLPDSLQSAPVTEVNASSAVLRHHTNSAIIFEDTEMTQTLRVHSQNESHALMLSKRNQDEGVSLASCGDVLLQSKNGMTFTGGEGVALKAPTIHFYSDEAIHIYLMKRLMMNGQCIHFNTENHWQCHSETGRIAIKATQAIQARCDTLSMETHDLKVRAVSGGLYAKRTVLNGKNKLSFQVNSTALMLQQGRVRFTGASIKLMASAIIKSQ